MNLPALQRIAMEFEKENDIMDQRQEMMDDAIDDVTGLDEEEESDEIVDQVLTEVGIDLNQSVRLLLGQTRRCSILTPVTAGRDTVRTRIGGQGRPSRAGCWRRRCRRR